MALSISRTGLLSPSLIRPMPNLASLIEQRGQLVCSGVQGNLVFERERPTGRKCPLGYERNKGPPYRETQ
jgi:hypothetical protein